MASSESLFERIACEQCGGSGEFFDSEDEDLMPICCPTCDGRGIEGKPVVIVESPYAGEVDENVAYARLCLHDCLKRGEAPFASHLLYTQPNVLDDSVPDERTLGIEAGLVIGKRADMTVVYTDRGISRGMELGVQRARDDGRPVEFRSIL